MNNTPVAITLYELNQRVTGLLAVPSLQNVWVTAELSDVRENRGHCYLELLQKDDSGANTVARMRANIWANVYSRLAAYFYAATGQRFATGLKVMVCGSVNHHPQYGLSFNIVNINPEFTMGDLQRRRQEILARLDREGILNNNRELEWPEVPQRVAVISAPGAAGYGDFINQLFTNSRRLRFSCRLFPALMQGDGAPASIIRQLEVIASQEEQWDCVVIIRGGGATSDLVAFEDYALAANVAAFPLPVIIGIGHERDVTVLDFVANVRVKTPTAAAELLVDRVGSALDRVVGLAQDVHRAVAGRLSDEVRRLSYAEALLPVAPVGAFDRAKARLADAASRLSGISAWRIAPERGRLDNIASSLQPMLSALLERHRERLDAKQSVLELLSPTATLKRGYSITRLNGHAVTDASALKPGDVIETVLAEGSVHSTVKK